MNDSKQTVIRGAKAITVQHASGYSVVYTQPINAKTGKPWQARRHVGVFNGDRHEAKAMACWLKTVTEAARASCGAHGRSLPTQ
jgi:hypothetical protein